MPRENRKPAPRLRRRVEVRYGLEEPTLAGYSGNISKTGMMIRCTRVFGAGAVLNLLLRFPEGDIPARARVSWGREGSITMLSTGRIGMGVRFIDPSPELLARIDAG